MDLKDWFTIAAGSFIQHIPQLLVITAGIVFCIFNLKKFRQASRIALAGLIILFLTQIVGVFLPALFTQIMLSYRDNTQTMGLVNMSIGFIYSLISAVGLGAVIYAVWIGRNAE